MSVARVLQGGQQKLLQNQRGIGRLLSDGFLFVPFVFQLFSCKTLKPSASCRRNPLLHGISAQILPCVLGMLTYTATQ